MSDVRILCLPDLLQASRSLAAGLHDLVREPIRQGCGIDVGMPAGDRACLPFLAGFEPETFQALAAAGGAMSPEALWAMTLHRMPLAAQDYLFAHLPEDVLLLTFHMPAWLRQACRERGKPYLDIRYSPLRFGRDMYLAIDSSDPAIRQRLNVLGIGENELRLEAALLGANVRSHRRRLQESMRHTFTLEHTLIYVSQSPMDSALIAGDGHYQRPVDFSEHIGKIAGDRQLLFTVDYSSPYLADCANQEREALAASLGRSVRACPQSAYQILSAPEDTELIGISAPLLHEARWFDKAVHWLGLPEIQVADPASSGRGYVQVRIADVIAPIFWHGLLVPSAPEPALQRLPALDRHHGREMTDDWGDYEKVLNWERALPWLAFERSGGIVHRRRLDALERSSVQGELTPPALMDGGSAGSMTARIQRLKGTKEGQTAYVLGNAPSLLNLDVNMLMQKESFWFNKAFAIRDMGYTFKPPYYFLRDPVGFQSWGEDVMGISAGIKFFSRETYSLVEKVWPDRLRGQDVIALEVNQTAGNCMFDSEEHFSRDPSKMIYSGYTSVLDAIQVAFYMGYSRVLVGGVELDYSQPYFYGELLGSRGGVQNWISARTRDSFLVARRFYERNGRLLAKITPSPLLPLEYVEDPTVQLK